MDGCRWEQKLARHNDRGHAAKGEVQVREPREAVEVVDGMIVEGGMREVQEDEV